jgi:transposase
MKVMPARKCVPALTAVPDPEVLPKPERRQFSAVEKLRLLDEADRCTEPGQIGALLRREGMYSSHLSKWRWLCKQGQLQALHPQQRGPKVIHTPEQEEIARLHREHARLQAKLAHAEAIIDIQKKYQHCWGCHPPSSEPRRGGRRASNGEHGGAVSCPPYPPQCRLSAASSHTRPCTTAPVTSGIDGSGAGNRARYAQ